MNIRRFALALTVLTLAVPAAAFAGDGIEKLDPKSSAPKVAMTVDVVLHATDPNELAEEVGYTMSGLFALDVEDGPSAELPSSDSRLTDLGPSAVSTEELASLLVDLWDRSEEPVLAEAVNGLGGILEGHKGVTATLQEQLDGIVKMLGLGAATPVQSQKSADPNAPAMPPGWRLYADGDETEGGDGTEGPVGTDGGDGTEGGKTAEGSTPPSSDTPLSPPPLVSINDDGGETVWLGDGSKIVYAGPGRSGPEPSQSETGQARDAIMSAVRAVREAAESYTSMSVWIGVKIEGGKETGLPTWGGMTINVNLPPYKYVDPDATYTNVTLSPEEVAARLQNELKDPVRPDDVQELPPATEHPPGDDPTLEHYDPDSTIGTLATDPQPPHGTAPIDYHRDAQPLTPQTNPAPTGDELPDGD